ncbi:CAMK protein kinase [Fusarium proliferatum]|nr:CAMK protein kinase [Fusarium proliferatum]
MQGTWIRKRKIGKGGFGIVWLENHLDSSRAVAVRAVKQIRKSSLSNRPERELQVIAKFSQEPPFITCYGWYENNDSLFIAMEFCEHGDLSQYLDDRGALPEATAQSIIHQVLEGLVSMHKNNYAHRDLKPLITDFGFSKRAHDQSGYSTLLGTPGFIAPEVELAYDGSGRVQDISPFPVDMWCLGETMAHIVTNSSCFNDSNTFRDYRTGTIPFPTKEFEKEAITAEAIDFVRSLMKIDPSSRMTAQEATEHKWMRSGSKSLINSTSVKLDEPSAAWTGARKPAPGQTAAKNVLGGTVTRQNGTPEAGKTIWERLRGAVSGTFVLEPGQTRLVAKPNDTENHNSAWTETSTSAFDDSYSSHSSPPPVREPSPVEERSWSQEASDGADRFHDYLHGDDYGSTGFYGSGTFD